MRRTVFSLVLAVVAAGWFGQAAKGDEVPASKGKPPGAIPAPFAGVAGPKRLLILAPDAFMDALQPLVRHKNATKMPALAIGLSQIKSSFKGVDEAEKIKRAIQYGHEHLSSEYVLLVGDAANFPVRFWFVHDAVLNYPNTSIPIPCEPPGTFIQSDLYYASLYHHTGKPPIQPGRFDSWDDNHNRLYNEAWMGNAHPVTPGVLNTSLNPDKVDGYPDVAVGRLPARNEKDVAAYAQKVITYEAGHLKEPQIHAARHFTFVHDKAYGSFGLTTNMVKALGLPHGQASISYLLIGNEDNAAPPPFTNATGAQVANQAAVSNWVSYVGHGSPNAWGGHGNFRGRDVAATRNSFALPVVYAAGCKTSLFCKNTPWENSASIDVDGITRGPFVIDPTAKPNVPGLVMTDKSTGRKWGLNTPGCSPLPVRTPLPNVLNVACACWANPWLFDYAPGGAIVYIGDHCVAPDTYPVEIETFLLKDYLSSSNPILGSLYLKAQQQYWSGPESKDAKAPNRSDYHGIPRLYLGWLVYFGDPSLRLPPINVPHPKPKPGRK